MGEKDDNEKHSEGIGCCHEYWREFLHVQFVLQVEVHDKGDADDGEDAVYYEVVNYCSFQLFSHRELSRSLVFLRDGQQQPREDEDEIVDDFPDHAHRVVALQGVVDIVGEDDDDDETEQPSEVDQDFDGGANLRHGVLVDQVGHVQHRQDDLDRYDYVKHI